MNKFLKKIAALVFAACLIVLCYPQIGNGVSIAKTIDATVSDEVETTIFDDENDNDESSKSAAKSKAAATSSSGGAARTFSATAYALRGRTASGGSVRRGIIAADPRVLPLGTRVQVTAGAWSGIYVVTDTGGAIKGNKIDIWVPSNGEAMRFGRRKVTVTVLGKR